MNGSRWACWVALPLALLLWAGIALVVQTPLLPTPAAVLETFWQALQSGELPEHLLVTLRRVLIAFTLAMALGTLLGVWMGRSRLANALLDPLLVLFLNLPALVTIILLYVWFGLVEAAAVLAVVVNKVPNVAVTVREGARSIDPKLEQIADAQAGALLDHRPQLRIEPGDAVEQRRLADTGRPEHTDAIAGAHLRLDHTEHRVTAIQAQLKHGAHPLRARTMHDAPTAATAPVRSAAPRR